MQVKLSSITVKPLKLANATMRFKREEMSFVVFTKHPVDKRKHNIDEVC
jgi:hypothetical protein